MNAKVIPLTEEEARIVIETIAIMRRDLTLTVAEAAQILLRADAEDFDS